MPKILILSSNPRRDLNLNREISDLVDAIQRLGKFELSFGFEVRTQELTKKLLEHSPQIVHFCGHGAGERGLVFQDENGKEQLLSTEVLARTFKTFADEINCMVLNACDSEIQAEAIIEHINYAIGMRQAILDRAAHLFSVGFYQGLGAGKSIEQAYELGCIAIQIWSETSAQSTQSRQYRKFEYAGEIVPPEQPELAEYLKPRLLKKSESAIFKLVDLQSVKPMAPPSPPSQTINLTSEFDEFIKQEIDRKTYKDAVRAVYDNFGQFSAQNVVSISKSEYSQRKILLGKVKQFWIEGFLQPSLQGATALPLGMKASPSAIADLTEGIEALAVELDPSYEKLKTTSIYAEMGQGRTLLILGSPGSGKTITLLQLAQRLIERSEQNPSLPIPVVFNLSSWARDRKPIMDWLIDELREKYQVPHSLSEPWIQKEQLILLLDGLDEVDENYRNDCVQALNDFIGIFPQTEIAVCSRVRDYDALTTRLQISGALCLQPLTSAQVYLILDSFDGLLEGLKKVLKEDTEIEEFARTPLILNFMIVAYAGQSDTDLKPKLKASPDRNRYLFETYIDRRLDRGATPIYCEDRVKFWLSWLASQMSQKKRTIFLIEKIQPNWLQDRREELAYRIITFMIAGLMAGFNGVLIGMLTTLLIPHLMSWDREVISHTPLIFGMTAAIIGAIVTAFPKTISPLEQLSWSWQRAKSRWVSELFNGICYGLVLGMISWLIFRDIKGLYFGLVLGHIFGLFLGLGSGLGSSEIKQHISPNQGIRSSVRNCIVIGLIGGLIFGLVLGLTSKLLIPNEPITGIGVIGGVIFGIIFGLKYGGSASTQHFTLRQILYRKGRIPWDYAKFLDFASERLLMKKIGGGYVFFHRMLLEHFVRMNPN
jgi:energy-coupling factor transporter ATP-binding protein EcfA2